MSSGSSLAFQRRSRDTPSSNLGVREKRPRPRPVRVRSASVSSNPIVRPASGPRPVRVRCREISHRPRPPSPPPPPTRMIVSWHAQQRHTQCHGPMHGGCMDVPAARGRSGSFRYREVTLEMGVRNYTATYRQPVSQICCLLRFVPVHCLSFQWSMNQRKSRKMPIARATPAPPSCSLWKPGPRPQIKGGGTPIW
eukprot:gene22333-biopygen7195